jgi:hypothetical protein
MMPCPATDDDIVARVRNKTTAADSGDAYTVALAYDSVLVAALLAKRLAAENSTSDLAAAVTALTSLDFQGATGAVRLTATAGGGVARGTNDTRIMVFTFPDSGNTTSAGGAAEAGGDQLLAPAAMVTFASSADAVLSPVPGGVPLVWPSGQVYPPNVPLSANLALGSGGDGAPGWLVWLLVSIAAAALLGCMACGVAVRRWARRSSMRSKADGASSDRGFGVPYLKNLYGGESMALEGDKVVPVASSPHEGARTSSGVLAGSSVPQGCCYWWPGAGPYLSAGSMSTCTLGARNSSGVRTVRQQPSLLGRAGQLVGLDGSSESRRKSNSVTGSAALVSKARLVSPHHLALREQLLRVHLDSGAAPRVAVELASAKRL